MTWDAVNVLAVSQAREIAGKLAGKILNVPRMNWMGISQVLCPFPCDVLVVYQPGKLALAPSVPCLQGFSDPQYYSTLTRVLLHIYTVKMSGRSRGNVLCSYRGVISVDHFP